jgi:oligopeptidase B
VVYSLANENWRTDNPAALAGQPTRQTMRLYHEDDEGFRVGRAVARNEQWLIICNQAITKPAKCA